MFLHATTSSSCVRPPGWTLALAGRVSSSQWSAWPSGMVQIRLLPCGSQKVVLHVARSFFIRASPIYGVKLILTPKNFEMAFFSAFFLGATARAFFRSARNGMTST